MSGCEDLWYAFAGLARRIAAFILGFPKIAGTVLGVPLLRIIVMD